MAQTSKPPAENEAHVAPNAKCNVLRPSITLSGVVLWPAFSHAAANAPAAQRGQTGVVLNHFHHTPGVMSIPPAGPQALAQAVPQWTTNEQLVPAGYDYDKQYAGQPLGGVDVDLFHGGVGVDLDDFDKFETFFSARRQEAPRVKELSIRFTVVDVIDDEDWFGKGELVFEGKVDGKSVGKTREMKVGSGEKSVGLAWANQAAAEVVVDVLGRTSPIPLAFSGIDVDVIADDSLGSVSAAVKPPWPTGPVSGCAANANFVVYWQVVPRLMTEQDKADVAPKDGGDPKKPEEQKLLDAHIGSRRTDEAGRFSFGGLRAGEYFLSLRGRLAFASIDGVGGEIQAPPADRHNGAKTAPLAAQKGKHALAVKVKIEADGTIHLFTRQEGAYAAYPERRLLGPTETLADIGPATPYRFYALPLVSKSNRVQWRACADELGHAFGADAAAIDTAMEASPILDLAALERFSTADSASSAVQAPAVDDLLKRTLLIGPAAGDRTMAYDHAYWCFAAPDATARTRGRFLPLHAKGFWADPQASDPRPLYRAFRKSKETFGRFALRFANPMLAGRDVRELKVRLSLWGDRNDFVCLRDDVFDGAVQKALVRFKRHRNPPLYRRRVEGANGQVDDAASVITSIVDAETYMALDAVTPTLTLDVVADRTDPNAPPDPAAPAFRMRRLLPNGLCRIQSHAAEIARQRLHAAGTVVPHSGFRTIAHNRRVYLTEPGHVLLWRFATAEPEADREHNGITTRVGGVVGRDGSVHAANAQATTADVRYDEPRGTYWGEHPNEWAADYSKHTTGQAADFHLQTGNAVPSRARVQWDTNALKLFGARRGNEQGAGKLWLEQAQVPLDAAANSPAITTSGTRDWIHLDTGDLVVPNDEYVLTERDLLGPRWDANILVVGRVTRGGRGLLGSRVELRTQGNVVVTSTFSDAEGNFSLRLRGAAIGAGYVVQAIHHLPWAYQSDPPAPVADTLSPAVVLNIGHAGQEVRVADLVVPAAAAAANAPAPNPPAAPAPPAP
jgi:hypothetical protein